MNKSNIKFLFISAFVLLLVSVLILFNHQKPRLLILHSYAEDGVWEKSFNKGVNQAIDNSIKPLSLRWYYMTFTDYDIPTPDEWQSSGQRAQIVINRWQPDVLIAVGEEAQEYVGRHYTNHDNIKLIYVAAEDPADFGYPGVANVSGVNEILPLKSIIQFLSHTHSKPLKFAAIGVNDPTGIAERVQLENFDFGQHELLNITLANDFAQWQSAVQNNDQADVLLVLSYAGLPKKQGSDLMMEPAKLASWTQNHAPQFTFGIRQSFVKDGGAVAIEPAPDGIGRQATEMALQILSDKNSPLPAVQNSRDFNVALRADLLNQPDLGKIPEIYFQASRAAGALY